LPEGFQKYDDLLLPIPLVLKGGFLERFGNNLHFAIRVRSRVPGNIIL
jgi:hypothetical protein